MTASDGVEGSGTPNFTGEWIAVAHDNLEALLRAQGVPDIPRAMAASSGIRQRIKHTWHRFHVTVNAYTTSYIITGGHRHDPNDGQQQAEMEEDEEEEDGLTPDQLLTASTMEWVTADEADGVGAGRKLVVSSVAPGSESERRMVGGRMVVVNGVKGVRATSTFERVTERRQAEEERKEKSRHDLS